MSEITTHTSTRHEDVDDATYSANARDARRTKPTAGILSSQISSEPFIKLIFTAIFQVQTTLTSNIICSVNTLNIIKLTRNDLEKGYFVVVTADRLKYVFSHTLR